jgi:hypothetical protein
VGAASSLEIHDAWPLATNLIQHRRRWFEDRLARCDRAADETRKQVFESAHKIVHANCAVTNFDVLQKKIYKSFKQEP